MAFLAVPNYLNPPRAQAPAPAPAPAPQSFAAPAQQLRASVSSAPAYQTGGFNMAPPAAPKRQVVNEPGYFGNQAPAVNAVLSRMLDPSYMDVNTTDRDINPLVQTIDRQGQQTARMAQAAAAERAAADGTLGTGGFANESQQIFEKSREAAGGQIAGVVAQKSQERQAQIMQALQLGGNLLDSQMKMNLERELADLQAAGEYQKLGLGYADLGLRDKLGTGDLNVRNRGLDIQSELGQGDLSLRRYLGDRGFDLQGRELDQNNNQFYDRLGFDRASFESMMNYNVAGRLAGY
jgi:hypothetical protein